METSSKRQSENRLSFPHIWVSLLVLMLASACASVSVSPDVPRSENNVLLSGELEFDGDARYLPTVVRSASQANNHLTIRYDYDVDIKDREYNQILSLFNPLVLFGFPIGTTDVSVVGNLEISREDRKPKTYSARYRFSKQRSLYSTRDLSKTRHEGLLLVRDRIDDQVRGDSAQLSRYTKLDADASLEREAK